MKNSLILLLFLAVGQNNAENPSKSDFAYEPTWESLENRTLPTWFDKARVGIMIHWGVYSVPSFGSEWFWSNWKNGDPIYTDLMNAYYPQNFTYEEFGKDFTAQLFNASKWAELFTKSGASYVVLTSKHHEGYTLWPSNYSYNWNSYDVGPHRDLVGELADAVRTQNLTFGVYYSLMEWFHPLYLSDKESNFTQQEFVSNKILPEMKELVELYSPDIFWSDGDWEAPDSYWNSKEFLTWLYNESPVQDTVVVNDRWGINTTCLHGGYLTCSDRYNPDIIPTKCCKWTPIVDKCSFMLSSKFRTLQNRKWEMATSIDVSSWGYRRDAELLDYYEITDIIMQLSAAVSCGGNFLLNVGPAADGTIHPIVEERLSQLGEWLSLNGEAIYDTKPWRAQKDSISWGVWYTSIFKNDVDYVYVILVGWDWTVNPILGSLVDYFHEIDPRIELISDQNNDPLTWDESPDGINIYLPDIRNVDSQWAWVLRIFKKPF